MIPILADTARVIVYRSRAEEAADAFWWDVMSDHPTATLVVLGLIALVIVAVPLSAVFKRRRR